MPAAKKRHPREVGIDEHPSLKYSHATVSEACKQFADAPQDSLESQQAAARYLHSCVQLYVSELFQTIDAI